MMVASKTEDYQLLGGVLDQGLKELGYSREDLNVELFASPLGTTNRQPPNTPSRPLPTATNHQPFVQ